MLYNHIEYHFHHHESIKPSPPRIVHQKHLESSNQPGCQSTHDSLKESWLGEQKTGNTNDNNVVIESLWS